MNKIKRWYYELTEEQVNKIAKAMVIIGILLDVINFFINYLLGRLPEGKKLIEYIVFLCLVPLVLVLQTYNLLWFLPSKQAYMFNKKHDEIIPIVREKFGLGPEFKEVLYVPNETDYDFSNSPNLLNQLGVRFFAREMDGVILVSIRNTAGKELSLQEIEDYNFFDSNFKPKE